MKQTQKNAAIIGSGIGGIATSILLAKAGYKVDVFERLDSLGGRARQFQEKGFTFDMGPSWYLMPGVFEHFFKLIDEDIHNHLDLTRLEPAYKVYFQKHDPLTIKGNLSADAALFESVERGAGEALKRYVARAAKTYDIAIRSFLYTNFNSFSPFLKKDIIKGAPFMGYTALKSLDTYVSSYVSDSRLKQILEYPMVFLGTSPFNAPALYHLMSYMDFEEGVYYPQGGIHTVIQSLVSIARKNKVVFHTDSPVVEITSKSGIASGVKLEGGKIHHAELVVSNADVHFTETSLLPAESQTYPESYWRKRKPSPSALLYYLGVKGKLPQLEHHTLYFADDWHENFDAIFKTQQWPKDASMYVCKPSQTDPTVAPKGHENIFILVPLPAREMNDQEVAELSERYFNRFKQIIGEPELDKRIVYKRIYTPNDFGSDYNSWQNSALGLSHTLRQSAFFRPQNRSKKIKNLYYVGGNTIPGIGLPMCLIGAELVYKHIVGNRSNTPLERLLPREES